MDTRPRTSLISFCTVQLWTVCAAHSLMTLCLSTTSGPDPGELPRFWSFMVSRHAPIPRKGSGNQQQQKRTCWFFLHDISFILSVKQETFNEPRCFECEAGAFWNELENKMCYSYCCIIHCLVTTWHRGASRDINFSAVSFL